MKAFILLADSARAHPDGTFSLLRGGISRVHAPKPQPIRFKGSVLIRMVGTINEAGEHKFQVRVVNEDGKTIAPDICGGFRIAEGGGEVHICIDVEMILPGYGRYTFSISINGQEMDTWDLRAVEARPQSKAGE